jgi:hypothetical protein
LFEGNNQQLSQPDRFITPNVDAARLLLQLRKKIVVNISIKKLVSTDDDVSRSGELI